MIDELVRRARRRILWNELVGQFAFAACVAMSAAVLLLVAGTELLDWRWLALITALSLAAGLYRASRRVPTSYRAAQTVDAAAGLKDALSTAVFFETDTNRPVAPPIREAQREYAQESARGVDLRQAIPFLVPRSLYVFSALVLVASSLFALRYVVERRMDLRPPLARVIMPWLGLNPEVRAEARKDAARKRDAGDKRDGAEQARQNVRERPDASPEQSLEAPNAPEVNDNESSATAAAENTRQQAGDEQSDEFEQLAQESDSGEGEQGETASAQNGKPEDEGTDRKPTSSPAESSLMAKLREAMSNLMSRMNIQPKTAGSPSSSSQRQQARAGSQKEGSGQQSQSQGQGQKQSGEGGQQSQDGQQGEESGNAQTADGKNASRGGEDSSRNAASGVGRQDGDKDVRMAEQLAAMGKISEIIGKRSANITGEITVEVRSGRQNLRTAYTSTGAQHGDSGGDVSRDEVPVAYQHYVQQYFAQVRRAAAAAKP